MIKIKLYEEEKEENATFAWPIDIPLTPDTAADIALLCAAAPDLLAAAQELIAAYPETHGAIGLLEAAVKKAVAE